MRFFCYIVIAWCVLFPLTGVSQSRVFYAEVRTNQADSVIASGYFNDTDLHLIAEAYYNRYGKNVYLIQTEPKPAKQNSTQKKNRPWYIMPSKKKVFSSYSFWGGIAGIAAPF